MTDNEGFIFDQLISHQSNLVAGVQALPALASQACTPVICWQLTELENAVSHSDQKSIFKKDKKPH
jgi:hypothetical protein